MINNSESSVVDSLIHHVDQGLRTLFGVVREAQRPSPAAGLAEAELSATERQHSAALMRVNHVGEVCAQALYAGQALTARDLQVRHKMQAAAREEVDHLVWCEQRLQELDSHTSYLNPLWYSGSMMIGIAAGLVGDRWSLGFVAETEHQVVSHLEAHLGALPEADLKSRAIVSQMRVDEAAHASAAIESGAADLPVFVKIAMQYSSKLMTTLAHWI